MPKTTQELHAEVQASAKTIASLKDAVAKPDCDPAVIEQFDEACAKHDEAKSAYLQSKASEDNATAAADRAKRAAEIEDWTGKFQTDTIQNPNYGREHRRAHDRMANDPEYRDDVTSMSLAAWGMGAMPTEIDADQREACKATAVNPFADRVNLAKVFGTRQSNRYFADAIRRSGSGAKFIADGAGYQAAVGYADSRDDTVLGLTNRAPRFVEEIATTMITFGGILNAPITIMVEDHYEDVVETYVTDQTTGRQIGEGMDIGTNVNPSNASLTWKNWDYTSDDVIVTNRQIERSRANLPSWIFPQLGERLGRRLSIEFTNGAGAINPHGIVPAVTAGGKYFTSATTAVIGYDDLHAGLPFAIDEAYRNSPSVGWMMNEPIMQYLMRMKDLEGRPMLNWGWEGNNKSRTLEGQKVNINRNMITTYAQNHKPIIYGDFSYYVVIYRISALPTLIRDDTTYRRQLKTAFTALVNADGRLRNHGNCPLAELRIV